MIRKFFLVCVSAAVFGMLVLPSAIVNGSGAGGPVASMEGPGDNWPEEASVWHDFPAVVDILEDTERSHSSIAKVYDIGDSWEKKNGIPGAEGRDILAIKISDNVGVEENEPEVLLIAHLHAGEMAPTEIMLCLIENLTDLYGVDERITALVNERETWIIPVANPDGMEYALHVDDTWRKNRRDNGDDTFGVDLNRNFDGAQTDDAAGDWGGAGTSDDTSSPVYCGASAFSEPETEAIRDLVLSHDFQYAADFHGTAQWLMWPWGYTAEPTPDNDDLVSVGMELAELTGYYASQSSEMYPTTGDSLDWLYGAADVYAYCIEVGGWYNNVHTVGPYFEWVAVISGDVERAIQEDLAGNIAAALYLIDVAANRS